MSKEVLDKLSELEQRIKALEDAITGDKQDLKESIAAKLRDIADDLEEEDELVLPKRVDPSDEDNA